MYNPSIWTIAHVELLLSPIPNRFSIYSNESFKWYVLFITVFTSELK